MVSAIRAFFAWWARLERAMDIDPVYVLDRRVRRLEAALAELQGPAKPTHTL